MLVAARLGKSRVWIDGAEYEHDDKGGWRCAGSGDKPPAYHQVVLDHWLTTTRAYQARMLEAFVAEAEAAGTKLRIRLTLDERANPKGWYGSSGR